MFQFVESIKVLDGKAYLLPYHQQRLDRTFAQHYPNSESHKLDKILGPLESVGLFKLRFLYNAASFQIIHEPYVRRDIKNLRLVESNSIDYAYKSLNREELGKLYNLRSNADDILIVKNNMITDSYSANIAFYDGQCWLTPSQPLLCGVKRQQLIDESKLKTQNILKQDLSNFQKASLINAMLDLGEIEVDINEIHD